MNRNDTLQLLRQHKTELIKRYDVNYLSQFGSTVRNQARADSDILLSFNGAATSQRYFDVQFYSEDLPGRSVDLVTEKTLRSELRPYIEQQAIRVWFSNAKSRMAILSTGVVSVDTSKIPTISLVTWRKSTGCPSSGVHSFVN